MVASPNPGLFAATRDERSLDRLSAIDGELLSAVKAQCDAATLAQLGAEADEELAPFKDRLSSAAFADARRAAMDRLIRERRRLPVIAFD